MQVRYFLFVSDDLRINERNFGMDSYNELFERNILGEKEAQKDDNDDGDVVDVDDKEEYKDDNG